MKHEYVNSRTVASVGYDPDGQKLHVTFTSGGRYTYHDVPPDKHAALMMSSSKGQYLHQNIKSDHEFTKI